MHIEFLVLTLIFPIFCTSIIGSNIILKLFLYYAVISPNIC